MEIKKVAIIGAGAIGAYFLWGMKSLPEGDVFLIADGERKERLAKEGIVVNGEQIIYPVFSTDETPKADLILIATKYGALRDVLPAVKAACKEDTIVISTLNGIDSEEIVGEAVGMEHMLHSVMRIASERRGNSIYFNPEVTMGIWFGEAGHEEITPKTQAVKELLDKTNVNYDLRPHILEDEWLKYAINVSRNLPQAVIGVGTGSYDDSEHMEFISKKLWEEVEAVAKAKGITIGARVYAAKQRKSARLSTLQDLTAKRHTEIDMFAGTMVKLGKEYGIPVPYCEYTYHAIKALEEKNDGKFDYTDEVF